jgi:hypothetical protein
VGCRGSHGPGAGLAGEQTDTHTLTHGCLSVLLFPEGEGQEPNARCLIWQKRLETVGASCRQIAGFPIPCLVLFEDSLPVMAQGIPCPWSSLDSQDLLGEWGSDGAPGGLCTVLRPVGLSQMSLK